MRYVGHEVTPHRIGLLQCRDVACQHHAPVIRIGMHLHRQAHQMPMPRTGIGRRIDQHIPAVTPRGKVSHESRIAHQVGQMLKQVAFRIDAELHRRRLVAPLDAPLFVQQHHAVRRRLDGSQKLFQPDLCLACLLLAGAQQVTNALGQLPPDTRATGRQRRRIGSQYVQEASTPPGIEQRPQRGAQPGAEPCETPAGQAAGHHGSNAGAQQESSDSKRHGGRLADPGRQAQQVRPWLAP